MPERLLTIKEILSLWPVSRQTLYNERARNPAFPSPVRIGNRVLFKSSEITAFVDGSKQPKAA